MIYLIIQAFPSALVLWIALFLYHRAKLSAHKTSNIKHLQISGLYWLIISITYLVAGPPEDMSARGLFMGLITWIAIIVLVIALITWINGKRNR